LAGINLLKLELMKDITSSFNTYYQPTCALIFYQTTAGYGDAYVEHFEMDSNGTPINPHPLSVNEAKQLAEALNVDEANFIQLKSEGILPNNLLAFDAKSSTIIWHTKAQFRELLFNQGLGITSGMANIPPLVWKADKATLSLFALSTNRKPTENAQLYYAPFFNVYENGVVCMGTVDIEAAEAGSVKELMKLWENYFFNSYFTHLMPEHNPVKGNCVLLWENLVNTGKPFPTDVLKKRSNKVKDILL